MWDRVLVRIGEGLAKPSDGAERPAREPFVSPRGTDLENDRIAAQIGIDPPGKRDQPPTDLPHRRLMMAVIVRMVMMRRAIAIAAGDSLG